MNTFAAGEWAGCNTNHVFSFSFGFILPRPFFSFDLTLGVWRWEYEIRRDWIGYPWSNGFGVATAGVILNRPAFNADSSF